MALRLVLLLQLGGSAQSAPDASGVRIAELEAEVAALRLRAESAEAALADDAELPATRRSSDSADDHTPGGSYCAAAPYIQIANTLPNGSYTKSCDQCVRWEDAVQCHCYTKGAVRLGAAAAGNISGTWAVEAAQKPQKTDPSPPPASPTGTVVRIDMTSTVDFTVTCVSSTSFYNGRGCVVFGPASGKHWHAGTGAVSVADRTAKISLDNGVTLSGKFSDKNFTLIQWTPAGNSTDTLIDWARQNATAIVTSLSLTACKGAHQLSNQDGHLSCDWKLVPPPRVGEIIYGCPPGRRCPVTEACRVTDHTTFVAPQYKQPHDPIATIGTLNRSVLLNRTGSLDNISGFWTSFNQDGSKLVAQDDGYSVIETIGPPPAPCATNKSIPCRHARTPHARGLRTFDVVCVNSGDYGTCSTALKGSSFNHWHLANLTLNLTSRGIYASYQGSHARHSGTIDKKFQTISWTEHNGGSLWSRQSGTELEDCCGACTKNKQCEAWTVDQLAHECLLSSSAAMAYPSTTTKGGYPVRADPATLCQEKFQNAPAAGAWQDNDLVHGGGITCASLAPNGYTKNVSDFPRQWRSMSDAPGGGAGHHGGHQKRGEAYFFFPSKETAGAVEVSGLDGYWSQKTMVVVDPFPGQPREVPPMFYIKLSDGGAFTMLCVDGGTDGVCDPVNPGYNGSVWHAGNGSLVGNNTLHAWYDSENGQKNQAGFNGTLGPHHNVITWSDGSSWHRSSCSCQCLPKDDPFCNQAKCAGAQMSDPLAGIAIKGKPWIVFFHGGAFKYFSGISGNYYAPSARLAKLTGMGVLNVDYRTTDSAPKPATFPEDLADIVQAMQWLKSRGASEILVYGDSSGGTQVIQLLLWMEHKRQIGEDPGVEVAAAVTFSGWLDMSASSTTYETRRWVGGAGTGMGDAFFRDDVGLSRLHAMCAADLYAGSLPISHPLVSPVAAPPSLLAKLPPLMLMVGGAEQLLGGNLRFAQAAQSAGARGVQLEVFAEMWHDFEMSSEGCGAEHALGEGLTAYRLGAEFLKTRGGKACRVVCGDDSGGVNGNTSCEGVAAVRWHMHYNQLPPP